MNGFSLISVFNILAFPELSASEFLVQDFAVIMVIAAVMLFITHKFKQSMVIGYLLAGMLIGPYTPPFALISNIETVNIFAELGIIILLFVIGIEFPLAKLKQIGRISVLVGVTESIGTMLITFFVAQRIGFATFDSLFLGLAMSVTSTVVTIKVLEEMGRIRDRSSTLILGILIIEDIIAVSALAILQSLAVATGTDDDISIISVSISIAISVVFIGSVLILGSRFLPTLIDKIGKTNNYALLLIVILGLAFGLSFIANLLGLSVVIGAFLAGVLVAESRSAAIAKVITIPLRDVFTALFFISIGALVNVSLIPLFIIPAIILIITASISKLLLVLAVLAKSKMDKAEMLRVGLGLAPARGEMSLIIAKGGQDVGVITSSILPMLTVVTVLTSFVAPYVIRFANTIKVTTSKKTQEEYEKEREDSE